MCDYSLHNVASRPAKLGDKLVTAKFANSVTRGFAAIGEPNVAVCVLPGTELAFDKEAEYVHPLARFMPRFGLGKLDVKVARFRQVNLQWPSTHHDALEFENGKIVLLTRLSLGQRATVLQLPAGARSAAREPVKRESAAPVASEEPPVDWGQYLGPSVVRPTS
jgi:hypothetical protein